MCGVRIIVWGPPHQKSKAINQLVKRASKFIITRHRGRNRGEGVIMLANNGARRKDIGEVSLSNLSAVRGYADECVCPE
jgi:hypothetical protein